MSESDQYTMNSNGNKPTTVQETPGDTQINLDIEVDRYSDDPVGDELQKQERVVAKQLARNHYALPGDEDEDDYEDNDLREHT